MLVSTNTCISSTTATVTTSWDTTMYKFAAAGKQSNNSSRQQCSQGPVCTHMHTKAVANLAMHTNKERALSHAVKPTCKTRKKQANLIEIFKLLSHHTLSLSCTPPISAQSLLTLYSTASFSVLSNIPDVLNTLVQHFVV